VALGLAVFAGYRRWTRPHGFNAQNMQITKLTDSGKVGSVAISPDGRYIVYVLVDGEQQSLWVRNVATKSDVQVLAPEVAQFVGVSFSPDGNYIYFVRSSKTTVYLSALFVMPVLGGPPRQLILDIDSSISFSPDGKQFTFMRGVPPRGTAEIRIANVDGSGDRLLVDLPTFLTLDAFNGVAWSPDGKTIVASRWTPGKEARFVLSAISVANGHVAELFSGHEIIGRPVWLPDGNGLVVPMAPAWETRTQLWTVSYPGNEVNRLTNDLADYGKQVEMTRDGQTLVAMERRRVSHIWVVPQGETGRAEQITHGEISDLAVAPGPGGKLLVRGANRNLMLMNGDGSARAPFLPGVLNLFAMSNCADRYVVFDSYKSGTELWRTDEDGSNPTKLAEEVYDSDCSPDGKWLLYSSSRIAEGTKIYRLAAEGGSPTELSVLPASGVYTGELAIAPDGKRIAYGCVQFEPGVLPLLAVAPAAGGPPSQVFTEPGDAQRLRWSPDGKGLQYLLTRKGATNLWEQRLAGGEPRQVTNFTSGQIFDFAWTRDGKKLLLAKGETASDVVLFRVEK